MTGSKSTIDLNLLFLFLPEIWYLKPKTKLTKCVFSFNKYWIFHFVPSERTDFREYRFLLSLLSSKKALEIKAVWRKHFNFPSLLFFHCNKNSLQKVFWKVGVLIFFFFFRNSWKAPTNNFLFRITTSWRVTFLLQRLLKSQVVTKCFSLILSWQLCRATILKNTIFSSTASAATSVDYNIICLHYSASLWINLFSSVCAYTLKFAFSSLLKLAY